MELLDIKKIAMQEIGFTGYDYEDEVETYEPALTAYINQAYTEVMDRFAPEAVFFPLEADTDVPEFEPGAYHTMLAYYAAGRILSSDRGEKQQRAAALLDEYGRMLLGIRRLYKRPHRLINKY